MIWLVVWNIWIIFHILGIVTPTDFHIFQMGRYTTNQLWYFKQIHIILNGDLAEDIVVDLCFWWV